MPSKKQRAKMNRKKNARPGKNIPEKCPTGHTPCEICGYCVINCQCGHFSILELMSSVEAKLGDLRYVIKDGERMFSDFMIREYHQWKNMNNNHHFLKLGKKFKKKDAYMGKNWEDYV